MKPEDSVHQRITSLQAYKPGMSIEELARNYQLHLKDIIKLASNENPYGASPLGAAAAEKALASTHLYPDQHGLRKALAKHHNVAINNVVLGNGSNDVLDLVARVFLGPDTEAISSEYGFSVYALVTQLAGAKNIISTAKDFGHDLEAMASLVNQKTRVIWIANPNNPTGTFINYATIKSFIESIPRDIVVVIDEAYFEYLDVADQVNSTLWLNEFPNLILTRTFSKIYGLAGLRIGYGLASESCVDLLNRARQPFNISTIGLEAAKASLQDTVFVEKSRQQNQRQKKYVAQQLDALNVTYIPSHTNFLTVHHKHAPALHEQLLVHGIIVRPLGGDNLAEYVRITIGNEQENRSLIVALEKILPTLG